MQEPKKYFHAEKRTFDPTTKLDSTSEPLREKRKSDQQFKKPFIPGDEPAWIPRTDLGILVKAGKVSAEDIFYFSLSIKEPEIVDHLFKLKEEIISIKSIQKQTKAGQRTRMKVVAVVGNEDGFIGIGTKAAKESVVAMRGAIAKAKLNLHPVNRGHWGSVVGNIHTVPVKASGKTGSVSVRVIPAPRGTGIVAGNVPKKICQLTGISDLYVAATGKTKTTENFAKAVVQALENATSFYTPSMWNENEERVNPFVEHAGYLRDNKGGRN
jgi:small subunit ribosomal protein S2e